MIDTQSKRMSIAGNGPLPSGTIDATARLAIAWRYNGNAVGAPAVVTRTGWQVAAMDDYDPISKTDDYQPVRRMDEFPL